MFLLVALHVLAATVWTGGHLVLALTVLPRALRASDPALLHQFESGYEKIGIPALLIQVITGFILALKAVPDTARWFAFEDTAGMLVFCKLALLAATMGLAIHARTRVLPDLDASKLRALAWHIVPVTVMAVLLVLVGEGLREVTTPAG
jgi:putative copper export protein